MKLKSKIGFKNESKMAGMNDKKGRVGTFHGVQVITHRITDPLTVNCGVIYALVNPGTSRNIDLVKTDGNAWYIVGTINYRGDIIEDLSDSVKLWKRVDKPKEEKKKRDEEEIKIEVMPVEIKLLSVDDILEAAMESKPYQDILYKNILDTVKFR